MARHANTVGMTRRDFSKKTATQAHTLGWRASSGSILTPKATCQAQAPHIGSSTLTINLLLSPTQKTNVTFVWQQPSALQPLNPTGFARGQTRCAEAALQASLILQTHFAPLCKGNLHSNLPTMAWGFGAAARGRRRILHRVLQPYHTRRSWYTHRCACYPLRAWAPGWPLKYR